jgi:hypothetical protein
LSAGYNARHLGNGHLRLVQHVGDFIELQLGTAQRRQQFSEHTQRVDDLRGERDHGDDRHRAHIARHGLQHAEASCNAEDEINHDALGESC